MLYSRFKGIFDKTIFENSKADLIEKVAKYPERYSGIFRPSRPEGKIVQNLLQSHEIRFGDAFEEAIEEYLGENGFCLLDKAIAGAAGQSLLLDQVFSDADGGRVCFIEQKIRDDHDSSKKVGQIANFENKLVALRDKYAPARIEGFFYFIDDNFRKNKKYYREKIAKLSKQYQVDLRLCYGGELFLHLDIPAVWDEILNHLKRWKQDIPGIPEINFDKSAQSSFDEIKTVSPAVYVRLFSNPDLEETLRVLFPHGETLQLLCEHFRGKGQHVAYEQCQKILARIHEKAAEVGGAHHCRQQQ